MGENIKFKIFAQIRRMIELFALDTKAILWQNIAMFTGVEWLVIGLCASGSGCSHAASAYYAMPEVKEFAAKAESNVKQEVGHTAVLTAGYVVPVIAAVAGRGGSLRLNQYFSVELNKDQERIVLQFHY